MHSRVEEYLIVMNEKYFLCEGYLLFVDDNKIRMVKGVERNFESPIEFSVEVKSF